MKRCSLFVLIVVAAFCSLAQASQMFLPSDIGITARGIAMGNAMTAVEGDPGLIYFNPAAMAKFDMSQVNFGYVWTEPVLLGGANGDLKEFHEGNNIFVVNLINYTKKLLKGEHPFAFGLNMFFDRNGRGFINFIDLEDPNGRFYRYGRVSTTATLTVGFGVTDWLFLGGGALITLRGKTDFVIRTDMGGKTNNEGMILDARLFYSPVASVFLDFKPIDIGAAYRGENYGQMGDITVDATATVGDSPLAKLPMILSFKDTFIPQNVAVGVCLHPANDINIAIDGTWYNWGRFDRIIQSGDLSRAGTHLDFSDTYVPRIGFEYFAVEKLPLRAGYSYQMTPMRKPGSNSNVFLDNNRHVGSLGIGYTFSDLPVIATPISLDAAYFHQYLVPDSYKTFEGKTFESEGNVNGGVVSLTFRF